MKLFYTDFQMLTVLNNVSIRINNIVVCHERISFNFQQLKILNGFLEKLDLETNMKKLD